MNSLAKKRYGGGEIRTRASEETGALNQRLRPLGHATIKNRQYLNGKINLYRPLIGQIHTPMNHNQTIYQFYEGETNGDMKLTWISCLGPRSPNNLGPKNK